MTALLLLALSYLSHAARLSATLAIPDGTAPALLDATITVSTQCAGALIYQVCCDPPCLPYSQNLPGEAAEGHLPPGGSPYTVADACSYPDVGSYSPRLTINCGNAMTYQDVDAVEVTAP